MEPTNDLKETETLADLLDADSTASVEDFIKELEAKEKDLHITADYQIEIEDSDFDEPAVPDFVREELETFEPEPSPVKAPAAGGQPGLKTRVYELEQEVAKLEARNKELRAERDDIQEKSDRRLKDFEAYKYRMDRERRGSFIDQISNLASQMLPVLDNLDRALDSADNVPEEKRNEFSQFFDGLTLVNQQINEVFAGMGVEPIKSVGEKFDPNFHEAVAVEERDDLPGNTITHEMLRGYRIGNRVVRHSMVKVTTQASGKNAEKRQAEKALHETPAEADNDDTPSTDVLPKDE
jgi:molecular chaperone GrpE